MLDSLTSADFVPRLQEAFWLSYEPSAPAVEVELIEVTDLGDPPPAGYPIRRRPFSLVFRAPRTCHLPQRIYTLENHTLGQLDLFLVPIGPDSRGMCYEAVFT
ncbi:MAG: hypothetical protein DIU80_015670 [Chloroflexota bacterium]|nr:MAG: hypothetical protein DIU80_06255 [Chloroflexota bacterium]